MGEVYQARDTKLHRLVALKILPTDFASDPDRLARFRREAQVLASLNHPNIAAIYGFEDSSTTSALVMEFVPGRTLADMATSPLALADALGIARQIATALEAAHEQQIVHRDLKPANIKITGDGTVKVLDFGLAKALGAGAGVSDEADASTITSPAMTGVGVILGTARYMAPEQAMGKPVDRRADIWALGVMLFEMLTGRALFRGQTVTETIAHVITQPPPWDTLPAATPQAVRRLLRRCLEKDPKNRLQSAGDVRLEIDECLSAPAVDPSTPGVVTVTTQPPRWQRVLPWTIAALLAGALAAALWPSATTPPRPVRLDVQLGGEALVVNEHNDGVVAVISPDGQTLAYLGKSDNKRRLYIRSLDRLESRAVPGSDDALAPFFSPDSRSIAFFTRESLKRVALVSGEPIPIAPAPNYPRGGTWGDGDIIVFPASDVSGLSRVAAGGGAPVALTTLGPNEATHRWPHFLPGGKSVLFVCKMHETTFDDGTIEAVQIDSGTRKELVKGGTAPIYVPGYLLYTSRNSVFAVRFDPDRLEVLSEPQPVQADVRSSVLLPGQGSGAGSSQISVANNGTAVYMAGGSSTTFASLQLAIVDRHGKPTYTYKDRLPFRDLRFSPDGKLIAVRVGDAQPEIRVLDPPRGTLTKLTAGIWPAWSHDGKQLAFACGALINVCLFNSDGTGAVRAFESDGIWRVPTSFSPDDKVLAIGSGSSSTVNMGLDQQTFSIADGRTTDFVVTTASEGYGQFSPNGKWMLYVSREGTAPPGVFVRAYPDRTLLRQVSDGYGHLPFWTKQGTEIVYVSQSPDNQVTLWAVSVKPAGGALELGKPEYLFDLPLATPVTSSWYHVTEDGNRFVVLLTDPATAAPERRHVTVVFNFPEEIRRQFAK
jgi:serine/threonine-protein kinase